MKIFDKISSPFRPVFKNAIRSLSGYIINLPLLAYVLNTLTPPTQAGGGPAIETRQADGSLALTQIPVDVPVFPGMYWNGTVFADSIPLDEEYYGPELAGTEETFTRTNIEGVWTLVPGSTQWLDNGDGTWDVASSSSNHILAIQFGSPFHTCDIDVTWAGTGSVYIMGDLIELTPGTHKIRVNESENEAIQFAMWDTSIYGTFTINSVVEVFTRDTTSCHPYQVVESKKIYDIYLPWTVSTAYAAGAKVNISGFWYSTVAGGTSGASAPVGFAAGAPSVTDNTVAWVYGGLYASGHGGVLGEPAGTNYVNWPINPISWGIINGCVITNLGNKNGLFNRASIAPNPATPSVFDRSSIVDSLALVANDIVTCRIFMEAGTSGKYNSIIKNIASSALTTINGTFNSSPAVTSVLAGTVTELSEVTSGGYTTLSFRFKASATSNFQISLGPNSAVIGETVIALGADIKKQLAFDSLVLTGAGSAVTRTASDITVPTSFSGAKPGALVSRLGYQKTMVPGGSLLKLPNTYASLSFIVGKTAAYIDEVLAGRTEFALMARTLNTSIFTRIDSPSGPYQLTFIGANGVVYQTTANNTTINVASQGLTAPVWVLVPKEVASDVGVTYISFASDQLVGLAPPIGDYPSLANTSYASNQLTGSAPPLDSCPSLSTVSYGYNKLTGLVPSLGNCPSLTYASYAGNGLTGVVSGFGVPNKAFTLQLGNSLFPAEAVNQTLAAFRAVLTVPGGTLNINGTGNAAPTGQGLLDKQWMIDLGWSVGTN